jgi:hypothetical protein
MMTEISKSILRVLRKVLHKNQRKYYLQRAEKYNDNECVVYVGSGFESESDNRVPLMKFVAIIAGFLSERSNKPILFAINANLKNNRLNTPQPSQILY